MRAAVTRVDAQIRELMYKLRDILPSQKSEDLTTDQLIALYELEISKPVDDIDFPSAHNIAELSQLLRVREVLDANTEYKINTRLTVNVQKSGRRWTKWPQTAVATADRHIAGGGHRGLITRHLFEARGITTAT